MSEDEAREVITAIVGPVDRPWDTRIRVALSWAYPDEMARVREAARTLGVDA